MGSARFKSYDKNLRRQFMLQLVETMHSDRGQGFRASLVVNPRTGMPVLPQPGEVILRRRTDPQPIRYSNA